MISLLFVHINVLASEPFFNISEQVKKAFPTVVKIKVQHTGNVTAEESELVSTDLGGSGFVWDSDRHIVTNAHVIKDAKRIVVVDGNDTEHPAALIAKDDKTDIAVLEAEGLNVSAPFLGESGLLLPGDGIFVLGSPYSLGYSVSAGVVSATKRFLPNYPYLQFIQTDAAINPGNSGGPVFNLNGALIGMASTYFSRQGGYTNIGFIIPIEDIQRIVQQLLVNKKIERGYLGAELLISDKLSRKMGYQSSVLITRIYPDSPAKLSGLKSGDLIVAVNGNMFRDNGTLHRLLERSTPDQNLTVSYVRDKKIYSADIRLASAQEQKKGISNVGMSDQAEKLGLILNENGADTGVEVLLSYAVAKSVGIDPHDKIIQINGYTIKTISDFDAQLGRLKENDIAMLSIIRNGETITLPIGSQKGFKLNTNEN